MPDCDFDWTVLRDNVLADVDRLNGAYTDTLTNHKVEIILDRAIVDRAARGEAGQRAHGHRGHDPDRDRGAAGGAGMPGA